MKVRLIVRFACFLTVNYHGEYSIQHVSKLNAKKAIDTCLENFNKYRLDIKAVAI